MKIKLPPFYRLSPEVSQARAQGLPIVALESTVITHGLPYPENLALANDMEATVRSEGATPATIALLDGNVHIGLQAEHLERLARGQEMRKISTRDFASAVAQKLSGGTTVAGTLIGANTAGLRIFATGGIGGVHRQDTYDVSADLQQLAHTPVIVVCAGAKAILDLPATLEVLETLGVPVIGYQTDEFPAFYSRSSGLAVSARVDTPQAAAEIAETHWAMGLHSAVLLTVPPPADSALAPEAVQGAIQQALDEAQAFGVRGPGITPFLLRRVSDLTGGASLNANLALLRNNARLAAQVARHLKRAPHIVTG